MSNPTTNRPRAPKSLPTDRITVSGRPDTVVNVALRQDTDTKAFTIRISVKSNVRPTLWGHKSIDANQSQEQLRQQVKRAAAQIAIWQSEEYKDVHHFASISKAADEALSEVFAQAERASRKIISIPKA